ncbi:phage tail protein [Ornithinibacillus scapharcae]|uniref:phage tail protein n=1 Tax=Ornithinibacillus scapharcae TaxID=1147159 RepID=UPI000225B2D9|nr:hypothetical protein [Ornithinibacillus scapharcae]
MAFDLTARVQVIDKFSSKFKKMTSAAQKLDSASERTSSSMQKMSRYSDGAGGSISRLRDKASGTIGKMTALAGAVGGVALAYKGFSSTIGGAANMEQQMISMEHFLGLTRSTEEAKTAAAEYVKYLRKNANMTPFATDEVIGAGRRSIQVAGGDIGQAKKMLTIAQDMAALNPEKTLSDAMEALADLATGETERLKEFGFKISADDLKAAGGAFEVMNNQIAETFKGGAEKLGESSKGLLSTITGTISSGLSDAGDRALERLKPQLKAAADWLSAGGADGIFSAVEKGITFITEKAIDFGSYIRDNWSNIKGIASGIWDALKMVGNVIQTVYEKAKELYSSIKDNWSTIKPIVVGITVALGSLFAAFKIMTVVQTVTGFIKAFNAASIAGKIAMLGFNAAIWASPMTWIVAGIVALIATIALLVANWDWVKAKAMEVWAVISAAWSMVWNKTSEIFNNIWNKIQEVFTKIGDWIKTKWNELTTTISTAIQDINEIFGDWIKGAVDIGKNFVQGIIDGFLAVWDSLKKTAQKIWDSITGIFDKKKTVNVDVNANTNTSPSKKVGNQNYHGDPYVAKSGWRYVHQGERIMTAQENSESKQGKGGVVVNFNGDMHVRKESDIDAIANKLAIKILRDAEAGA